MGLLLHLRHPCLYCYTYRRLAEKTLPRGAFCLALSAPWLVPIRRQERWVDQHHYNRRWVEAMAHLEVLEGFHHGQNFPLPEQALVGRHPESFLCLSENSVSRYHARILQRGSTFIIEDLQSANGVTVQGKRLAPRVPHALHDGDEILICSTRMVFHADPPSPKLPQAGLMAARTVVISKHGGGPQEHHGLLSGLMAAELRTKRSALAGAGGALRL